MEKITRTKKIKTEKTCDDCGLYVAEYEVTVIDDDETSDIKYLCHHCEMLAE